MLSKFGQALRDLRIVNNEVLKDMSDKLGIRATELSAIECGKCIMSKESFGALVIGYNLSKEVGDNLVMLFKESRLITPTCYYYKGMRFNKERFMKDYKRNYERALEDGFTDEELKTPYLDRLCKLTKSRRILNFIRLAYTLGLLRGIHSTDEGYTPISCGGGIERIVQSEKPLPKHEQLHEV